MTADMTLAEYNAKADLAMPERELQEFVRVAAKQFGWLYFHVHDSRHSPSGFPDCVMVRGIRLIFAELKREKGRLSTGQQTWATALLFGSNAEYYIWRPSDRDDILEVLR